MVASILPPVSEFDWVDWTYLGIIVAILLVGVAAVGLMWASYFVTKRRRRSGR